MKTCQTVINEWGCEKKYKKEKPPSHILKAWEYSQPTIKAEVEEAGVGDAQHCEVIWSDLFGSSLVGPYPTTFNTRAGILWHFSWSP